MNDISIKQIKNAILKKGLTEDEFCLRAQLKRDEVLYDSDLEGVGRDLVSLKEKN